MTKRPVNMSASHEIKIEFEEAEYLHKAEGNHRPGGFIIIYCSLLHFFLQKTEYSNYSIYLGERGKYQNRLPVQQIDD